MLMGGSLMTDQKLMYVSECATRSLIRFYTEEDALWGIVGEKSRDYFPILVLSGPEAPFVVGAVLNGHTIDNFNTHPVVNYSADYEIVPAHAGRCQIGADSQLRKTKGSLVYAGEDRLIAAGLYRQEGINYFNLRSGNTQGAPGGLVASFESWWLNVTSLSSGNEPFKLRF
jgi:hypothetical protein